MPAIASTLSNLVKTNVDSKFSSVSGVSPLAQSNPSYFIEMCTAIGTGIANGTTVINFTTSDTGLGGTPPVPGNGTGVGIIVDDAYFTQKLYTELRNSSISSFGSTTHDPYPPGPNNISGKYLKALCEGISISVKTHFQTAWTLTSAHPLVYSGVGNISNGSFSGLTATNIEQLILAAGPSLQGVFWPKVAKKVAEVYVDTIHNHSTATVTIIGVCVPLVPPAGFQICGVPAVGAGTGVAS